MVTVFIILYNIFKSGKSQIHWLNLNKETGLNFALFAILIDVCIYLLCQFLVFK